MKRTKIVVANALPILIIIMFFQNCGRIYAHTPEPVTKVNSK